MDTDVDVRIGREYLRVSFDRSGRERSNSEQQDDNRRVWAGWEWADPYSDAVSASRYSKKARDDWGELIGDLRRDRFGADALVLWESSRGSRRVGEWVDLLDLLEARSVRVAVTEHRRIYDPANPRDRRSLLEDAVDAEYESAKTSGRLRRSRAADAAAGRPHGRIPYGYQRVYDQRTGLLLGQEPLDAEAAVVREVFARIRAGHSLRSIALDFEDRGLRTRSGHRFSPQRLRAMAINHIYVGERVHAPGATDNERRRGQGATYTKAEWPPLVDRRTWLAVQRILSNPARKTTRPSRGKYLLSCQPHVVCDVCGRYLSASYRNDAPSRIYVCHTKGCVRVKADDLDNVAEAAMLGYLSRPDNIAQLLDDSTDSDLEAARLEVAQIRAELDDLADQVGRGDLTPMLAARAEPQIRARLAAAEARETELSTPSALRGLIEPGEDVHQRWNAAPMSAKRRITRLLLVPHVLGELRVLRNPVPGRPAPIADRVAWKTAQDSTI
ncbi:MAG: recombinase family protein [Acidimicrobiales bacterium]